METEQTSLQIAPCLIDTEIAATVLGISKRFFLSLEAKGEIGPLPCRLGRRVLYSVDELNRWAAAGCPSRAAWMERKNGR